MASSPAGAPASSPPCRSTSARSSGSSGSNAKIPVAVAATTSLATRLPDVVAVADHAATAADRFAALTGNPQRRYRIYLATDQQWRAWYGGEHSAWAIGYTIAYPAWPLLSGATPGLLGYSSRGQLEQSLTEAKTAQKAPARKKAS